ncbi:nucleotide pyrophosphatase [Halobacteriales archaeon SW_7_68_16]|nr:MAG: nucleotide pyrophosphatase [Halobacteriales archaeon SW_7_68_16]
MGLLDRFSGDDSPRVAFVGIDGVPFSLLSDHFDEFENFAALADEGTAGEIDSIVPPESSACWPALTTGRNPGETGVYGFQDREVGSYDPYVPMGREVQSDRVWDHVSDADRESSVMNVPVTFPPQRDLQRMVSGFLSPGLDKAAHPEEFQRYLENVGYRLDINPKLGHDVDKTEFIENAHETIDARQTAFKHVIERDDWDLFFGVFMTTDRVNHFLYGDYDRGEGYHEEFMDFYRKLDRYVGELRATLPDDTTLIVASDHGFTREDYEVYCNEWLRQNGWLSYETDDYDELGDIADDARAYSLIPGRFYINREGREPRGCVPDDEYEDVRAELRADIEGMTGPDGNPVVDRVVAAEDAFRGDHADIAPDLVAIPNDGFDLKAGFDSDDAGSVFVPTRHVLRDRGEDPEAAEKIAPRNGMHSFDDTSLFLDAPDATLGDCNLLDVAPTILRLMDVDYDRTDFDGASLV